MTYTLQGESDKLRVVDLFAGCGGLTSGFHSTERYQTVGAVEFDLAAAATYAANFGEENMYWGNIAEWVQGKLPSADVVIGGPPCQGFSSLGKRDVDDPRNSMWRHYVEALVKIQPKVFLLENVPQFQRSRQFESLEALTRPGQTLSNYSLKFRTVVATNFGAAQLRRRLIVIGTHNDYKTIDVPEGDVPREAWRTVRDVIWNLRNSVIPDNTEPSRRHGLLLRRKGAWRLQGVRPGLRTNLHEDDTRADEVHPARGRSAQYPP